MKTLTKALTPFQIKALDEGERTFRGLASTWDEDLGGDVIHEGAFAKTLKDWRKSGKPLPLIDQHNYGSIRSVVGKMTDAAETSAGLEATFQIIDGPDGDEVLRRVKGGYIDSLSIGYEAVKWEMEREEGKEPWESIRHLKEIKLHEVSVVIWPMNPNALIDSSTVKSMLDHIEDPRELRSLASHIGNRVKRLQTAPGDDPADEKRPTPPDVTPSPEADSPKAMDAPDFGPLARLKLARIGGKLS